MKSILMMIAEKNNRLLQEILSDETIKDWNYFEAHNFQEVYELSVRHEWGIVIVTQGLEDSEEQIIITYLNQKNASTVFMPFARNGNSMLKKRIKRALKTKEHQF